MIFSQLTAACVPADLVYFLRSLKYDYDLIQPVTEAEPV